MGCKRRYIHSKKKNDSICVSNLPFSIKKEIFQHLKDIDQPFIILAPSTCLHTKYFNEIFAKEKIQLIIPSTKRNFDRYVDGVKSDGPSNCSFYTLYICYKAGLDHDVNFIIEIIINISAIQPFNIGGKSPMTPCLGNYSIL